MRPVAAAIRSNPLQSLDRALCSLAIVAAVLPLLVAVGVYLPPRAARAS
jgi:hypothetical protein